MTLEQRLILAEAKRWVGVREELDNSGQLIELFQKAVNGQAAHEPWCMGFVHFVLQAVQKQIEAVTGIAPPIALHSSESCVLVARNSTPSPSGLAVGTIAIWQKKNSPALGHAGIVTSVIDSSSFTSIEGNTSPGDGIIREGVGVFQRTRNLTGDSMRLLGFYSPFGV